MALAAACQGQTQATPAPSPVPTPHTTPLAAVLQPTEVPGGLFNCLASGPIDSYVTTVAGANPPVSSAAASEWAKLKAGGATAAAISIYADDATACAAEVGATSSARSAMSFVAIFGDAGEADRAWSAGVFGFTPPAVGEQAPGVTLGSGTGLGTSSFTFERTPVLLASWHRSAFVAVVVFVNLDAGAFRAATAAVDARLN